MRMSPMTLMGTAALVGCLMTVELQAQSADELFLPPVGEAAVQAGPVEYDVQPPLPMPEVTAEGGGKGPQDAACGPIFQRYPVAGPHNNGYDAYWNVWTCGTANSGSDFSASSHLGNDIFGAKGTPIVAAQAGTISYSFSDRTGGTVVYVVDDCGWWHYYAHLETRDPGLYIGQRVVAGTRLGTLGNSGSASGTSPHLHYSVYPGTYSAGIDPFPYLYGTENGACQSGNACSCLQGINVKGYSIPVTDTDCGHRVCGVSTELWSCGTNNAWARIGGSGSCSAGCTCPGGKFKNGRDIPSHMTHCGYRVCGMNLKYWDCTAGGWVNSNVNCQ